MNDSRREGGVFPLTSKREFHNLNEFIYIEAFSGILCQRNY